MKEVVHHLLEYGNSGVRLLGPLSCGVTAFCDTDNCWSAQCLIFFPIDDKPQVFAEIKKEIPMFQQMKEWLWYDEPII